nr:hypothetical protein [Angustibacter aerolatus]
MTTRMDPAVAKRFRSGRPCLDLAHTAATPYWSEPEPGPRPRRPGALARARARRAGRRPAGRRRGRAPPAVRGARARPGPRHRPPARPRRRRDAERVRRVRSPDPRLTPDGSLERPRCAPSPPCRPSPATPSTCSAAPWATASASAPPRAAVPLRRRLAPRHPPLVLHGALRQPRQGPHAPARLGRFPRLGARPTPVPRTGGLARAHLALREPGAHRRQGPVRHLEPHAVDAPRHSPARPRHPRLRADLRHLTVAVRPAAG